MYGLFLWVLSLSLPVFATDLKEILPNLKETAHDTLISFRMLSFENSSEKTKEKVSQIEEKLQNIAHQLDEIPQRFIAQNEAKVDPAAAIEEAKGIALTKCQETNATCSIISYTLLRANRPVIWKELGLISTEYFYTFEAVAIPESTVTLEETLPHLKITAQETLIIFRTHFKGAFPDMEEKLLNLEHHLQQVPRRFIAENDSTPDKELGFLEASQRALGKCATLYNHCALESVNLKDEERPVIWEELSLVSNRAFYTFQATSHTNVPDKE